MNVNRILALVVLSVGLVYGQGQYYDEYGLTLTPSAAISFNLNTTATGGFSASWLAAGYIPVVSKTISKVKLYVATVTGTLGVNDLVLDIYTDNNGLPGTSIGTTNTVTAIPTSNSWVEFTGLSVNVTAYSQYWFIMRNANAAPTTNYASYRYYGNGPQNIVYGPLSTIKTSTNSGGSWTNATSGNWIAYRVQFSDNTYTGLPFDSYVSASNVNVNYRIYGTRQAGISFITPANAKFNLATVVVPTTFGGTPTGNLSCNILLDSTGATVASSNNNYNINSFDTAIPRPMGCWFSPSVTLSQNTKYRIVLVESIQSDTSINYFVPSTITMQNDANSLALLPFAGTLRGTYCSASCGSSVNWTDDATNIPMLTLGLDPNGEFGPISGGSGGQKNVVVAQ